MSRKKIYDTWSIPRGVAKIAKAVCADYERRSAVLRAGSASNAVLEEYRKLNAAVDAALAEIEEPAIRADILKNIIERRGYEKSFVTTYICENSYYARQRRVLCLIAKNLLLI